MTKKYLLRRCTAFMITGIVLLFASSCSDDAFNTNNQKTNNATAKKETFTSLDIDLDASIEAPYIENSESNGTKKTTRS